MLDNHYTETSGDEVEREYKRMHKKEKISRQEHGCLCCVVVEHVTGGERI
jgi:hypothetical protein